jgi:hypothetical protein
MSDISFQPGSHFHAVLPRNANEFIEQQLDERIRAIELEFRAHALTFVGPIVFGSMIS